MEWKAQVPLQVLWHSALLALPSSAPSLWDHSHCFRGAVGPGKGKSLRMPWAMDSWSSPSYFCWGKVHSHLGRL